MDREHERICDECGRHIAIIGETVYVNAGVRRCEDCWRKRTTGQS